MNYEGAGDACDFAEETAIAALNVMESKPILMHRIWSATVPRAWPARSERTRASRCSATNHRLGRLLHLPTADTG